MVEINKKLLQDCGFKAQKPKYKYTIDPIVWTYGKAVIHEKNYKFFAQPLNFELVTLKHFMNYFQEMTGRTMRIIEPEKNIQDKVLMKQAINRTELINYEIALKDIKFRLEYLDSIKEIKGITIREVESLALQIRKILEALLYAILGSNKILLPDDRIKPETVFSKLKDKNPNFWPKAIQFVTSGEKPHFKDADYSYLSVDDFLKIYKECSGIIHAQNPLQARPDITKFLNDCERWEILIRNMVKLHLVSIDKDTKFIATIDHPFYREVRVDAAYFEDKE